MTIVRKATPDDANSIAKLIQDLAQSIAETSPITPAYAKTHLTFPGCHILLAEESDQIVGLLSYSIRPNLYHSGDTALIEELVIESAWRGQGLGSKMVDELLDQLKAQGCLEVSVTTTTANHGAIRFYHQHGLVDQAVHLEMHL